MPQKPADEPLEKVTLNLFARDMHDLRSLYGHGVSEIIRQLIRQHLKKVREQVSRD